VRILAMSKATGHNSRDTQYGRYWVCLYTRDGAATLSKTLESIMKQTKEAEFIVAVDDGSNDSTPTILRNCSKVAMVRTESKTRNILRAPRLINMAYARAEDMGIPEYCMITGDDCIYPSDYAAKLLKIMDCDPALVIASGGWNMKASPDMMRLPQGAGRVVRECFMKTIGGRYPERYGWEAWLLYKAMQMGYRVLALRELRYTHARAYSGTQTFNWGRGMQTLGYDVLFVLARLAKNMLSRSEPLDPSANLTMLAGYLSGFLPTSDYSKPFDSDLREFIRQSQHIRMVNTIRLVLTRITERVLRRRP